MEKSKIYLEKFNITQPTLSHYMKSLCEGNEKGAALCEEFGLFDR
jgi:hypothetical protein